MTSPQPAPKHHPPSDRTRVRRLPERATYDPSDIGAILDAGYVCHVGFTVDGETFVIPTIYGRDGDTLVLHGSFGSRMLRVARAGAPLTITVTLVDAFVVARSAMHHSLNYRSVVLFGQATEIKDTAGKRRALEVIVEHVLPGRWQACRKPNEMELRHTAVLSIPITEASAKVRTGPPKDDPDDLGLGHWAGVVPLRTVAGPAIPTPDLAPDADTPDHIPEGPLDLRV